MKNKRRIIQSIILLSIALTLIVIAINMLIKNQEALHKGQVEIEIYLTEDEVYKEKIIYFDEGDTLVDLLTSNFDDVLIEESSYGPFLLGIEGYVTPTNYSTYLIIYVNDIYSQVGISQIELLDNLNISIKVENA